jgi:hypothetical protein
MKQLTHRYGWKAYKISFTKTPRSKDVLTWERFAEAPEDLDREVRRVYNKATIISIVETVIYERT